MGNDYLRLRALINKYWPEAGSRPKLIGNDLNTNPSYLQKFLPVVKDNLDVVTYHLYVGYGLDPNLAKEIPTANFLNQFWATANTVYQVKQSIVPQAEMWVGETAAAWHSGQANTTDAFVSSFWYANAMAVLTLHNHTGFCRQVLLGGNYGLLQRTNYRPNPDYWTATLFHRLMGNAALAVSVNSTYLPPANLTLFSYA